MMKTAIAGGVAAIGLMAGSVAFAADMPTYTPPAQPAPMAPVFYDWSGVYVGVTAGYAWGDFDFEDDASLDGDGFLVGGTLGANWQVDQFVFGIEGDLSWSDVDGSVSGDTFFGPASLESEQEWLATVRGRVGVAVDQMLIYGTGGLAMASIDTTAALAGAGSLSDDETHVGWTIGAGIEAGLTENLSAKVEYLYVDLGDEGYSIADVPFDQSWDGHVLRAGLNYRFSSF